MCRKLAVTILISLGAVQNLYAAIGCSLTDPDRDIKRLFPNATNYKTEFITIAERGGKELAQRVEAKLKDKLEPTYEALDVPYTYYTVLKEKDIIGYVHGVNQKGMFGVVQLIITMDPNGVIMDFYYQKLTSPESKKFRDEKFTKQFVGLSLMDFYTMDMKEKIKDPGENSQEDYLATLRGIKKNLILTDEFKLNNKYDKYFYSDKNKDESMKGKENGNEKQN
jgi:protein-tyrosine-phosphatase